MTRKGNALVKLERFEEAIAVYNKSLMEDRNADTLKRLNETERELKDRKTKAYLDPVKAEEAREQGNTLFKEQKYPEAVEKYTEAIRATPTTTACIPTEPRVIPSSPRSTKLRR